MDFDPDHHTIKEQCQQLVGKDFVLSVSFDSEILPLEDCEGLNNAVGSILEQTIFLVLKKVLEQFERGPKQKSPDYYNRKKHEYELKVFEKSAGFDISAYNAYIEQLALKNGICRKVFNTKYLVFKYNLSGCNIRIQKFWMLNIWDLVSCTGKYPISIQNKRGIWYNIRPSSENGWVDSKRNAKKFIESIVKSIQLCPNPIHKDKIIQKLNTQIALLPISLSDI
jgi:hypothetical protein